MEDDNNAKGLQFTFKGEIIKIGPSMITKYSTLSYCKRFEDQKNVPIWMDSNSLKLFLKLVVFGDKFTQSENLVGKTNQILKLLWYSDFFVIENIQIFILREYVFLDINTLNSIVYLHEGLKKIMSST